MRWVVIVLYVRIVHVCLMNGFNWFKTRYFIQNYVNFPKLYIFHTIDCHYLNLIFRYFLSVVHIEVYKLWFIVWNFIGYPTSYFVFSLLFYKNCMILVWLYRLLYRIILNTLRWLRYEFPFKYHYLNVESFIFVNV